MASEITSEHELEMNRLNVQEREDKHVRSIALKASDVIPLAQLEWFLTFLGIILSWLWDRHFIIELDQGFMNKNSPKLVPKHKLIWKFQL